MGWFTNLTKPIKTGVSTATNTLATGVNPTLGGKTAVPQTQSDLDNPNISVPGFLGGVKPTYVGGSALPGDPGYQANPLIEQPYSAVTDRVSAINSLLGQSAPQETMERAKPTIQSIALPTETTEVMERAAPTKQNITLPQQNVQPANTPQDVNLGLIKPINKDAIAADPVDFSKTATNPGYSAALDELSGAVRGKGFSGTNAAIDSSRQALLAANKQAEAQAGSLAQRTGNIGQGVANSMSQETRQSALQNLAGQESKFIELKSADQKAAIDKMVQAEQSEKNSVIAAEGVELQRSGQNLDMEQINRQFLQFDANLKEQIASRIQNGEQFNYNRLDNIDRFQKTMALTEKQWTAEFGSQEGQKYMNNLLELSIDNPVLAQKLQNYLLTDQKGAIGAFTPAETAEIGRLKIEAEKKENDLNNIYAEVLKSSNLQTKAQTATATDELAGINSVQSKLQEVLSGSKSVNELDSSFWKNASDNQISQLGISEMPSGTYFRLSDWESSGLKADNVYSTTDDKQSRQASSAGDGKGSVVMYQGKPYRITSFESKKDTTGSNERIGRVRAVPLDGSSGPVEISSTGWKEI